MTYHLTRLLDLSFDAAVAAVTEALKGQGFGVLTDIDVAATLKAKIGAEFRPYRILGACNPKLALDLLTLEDKAGTMMPCNVVVQLRDGGKVEVSAIDPVASFAAVDNPALKALLGEVRAKLQAAIDAL